MPLQKERQYLEGKSRLRAPHREAAKCHCASTPHSPQVHTGGMTCSSPQRRLAWLAKALACWKGQQGSTALLRARPLTLLILTVAPAAACRRHAQQACWAKAVAADDVTLVAALNIYPAAPFEQPAHQQCRHVHAQPGSQGRAELAGQPSRAAAQHPKLQGRQEMLQGRPPSVVLPVYCQPSRAHDPV